MTLTGDPAPSLAPSAAFAARGSRLGPRCWLLLLLLIGGGSSASAAPATPNVILIFTDDLGYGDLAGFGGPGFATPNLDRMAAEGRRLTHFHAAQAVCSASRAALLTGCYPNRLGIHGALGPQAKHGLDPAETTLADLFRQRGYATGMAGKWHLGHREPFLPAHQGFDEWFGLPYSNDMWPRHPESKAGTYPSLPLFEGGQVLNPDVTPADQARLTAEYTAHAVDFIRRHRDRPFFFYLATSMPHVPLFVGERFRGRSGRGLYGDVMLELDWSVGEILRTVKELGLDEKTLVLFTSDNGPWLSYGDHAGSSGPLREGKGTSWEGGTRVPCLVRWPGRIPAGSAGHEMIMTIDLLPTFAKLIGADLPPRKIDGLDVWPLLSGEPDAKNPHAAYFCYYEQNELQAVWSGDGRWKLMLPHAYRTLAGRPGGTNGIPAKYEMRRITQPELYDLQHDLSESTDVAAGHPEIVQRLLAEAERAREDLGDALSQRVGTGVRPPGRVE